MSFDKFTDAYLSIIMESKSLVKDGKIEKSSVLEAGKENTENQLFNKTYSDFEQIAKKISRNITGYDAGDQVTCPVCGEKLTKNTNRQWGHVKDDLNHTSKDGKKLKVRNCSMKWNDALRAWNKQYPEDKGEAVEKLKNLSK